MKIKKKGKKKEKDLNKKQKIKNCRFNEIKNFLEKPDDFTFHHL